MKIFKKCACIALALVMAQGVAVTSFAAETYANESSATVSIAGSSAVTRTTSIELGVGQGKDVNGLLFVSGRASYSSKNPDIVSVSNGGKMRGVKAGRGTVRVDMLDTGEAYECYVTVKAAPTGVVLNKTSVTQGVGQSFTLTPSVSPSGTINKVTWSTNNRAVATVSTSGVVNCLSVGTATITARTYNGKTATCTVTVKAAPTSLTLNKTSLTIATSMTYNLIGTVSPSGAFDALTFKSSNTGIATVSSKGVIRGRSVGTVTITATTYNGKSASCKVTVKPAPTAVKLSKTSLVLSSGSTTSVASTLTPSNAYNSSTWKSSNTNVATVTGGVIYAKAAGTATITVTTYNGKSASCNVTVKAAPTAVKLSRTSLSLEKGKTFTLTKTLTPSNAYDSVTWTSSNSNVASVSSSGVVTAKGVGTATVTVKTYNGKTASCTVTVKAADDTAAITNEVVRLVNAERKKKGLSALTTTTKLTAAAQKRAVEISQSFSHTRPNGTSCFTIFSEYGISNSGGGANVACGYSSPQSVMDGWMESSGHKANILNSNFKSIGVGYYVKDGSKYWVQLFIA